MTATTTWATPTALAPRSSAWTQFGVNVDGLVTTASSTNVCTLAAGSSKQAQAHGALPNLCEAGSD